MICNAGDKLCACTVLQKCGEGSYGEVFLAENAIGGKVALKILRGKYSGREIAGLKNYKDCNHPNLLKIRHIEIIDDTVCYTMDAADDLNGGAGQYLPDTLANRLKKSGKLDEKEILAMLDGLLDGLDELHKKQLIHRDIKPDNILWINGRVTLSDAGLIAPAGKHTLVGSPGFVSPRLLASGGMAEISDDFYALSKVIYCALTGLSPAEYPAIPPEMTISLDPAVNRAILAGCSQKITSGAEFRRFVFHAVKQTAKQKRQYHLWLLPVAAICGGISFLLYFLMTSKAEVPAAPPAEVPAALPAEVSPAPVPPPVPAAPQRSLFDYPQLPDLNYEYYRGRKTTAADVFRHFELYQEKYLPELLNHRIFSARLVMPEISDIQTAYYNKPEAHQVSLLSMELQRMILTGQAEDELLKNRQQYWWEQSGKPENIIRRMLTEDPVMQMAAINMLLEKFCRHILEVKEYEGKFDQTIRQLIRLQSTLTTAIK